LGGGRGEGGGGGGGDDGPVATQAVNIAFELTVKSEPVKE